MGTIQELRGKHTNELNNFVRNCKHEEIGDWVDFYSAWDDKTHFGQARICKKCEILIELKDKQGKIIIQNHE